MNSEIERRLGEDAHGLDEVRLSADAGRRLDARLAATRQAAAPSMRLPSWPALAAAAAVGGIVAGAGSLWWPDRPAGDSAPVTAVTVPAPGASQALPAEGPQPLPVQVPLQRVSHAAPLEAEWVALREDLERTRERIERELPVRF